MKYDTYGNPIFQSNDLFNMMYKNHINFDDIIAENTEEIQKFIQNSMLNINVHSDPIQSILEFDQLKQSKWNIPEEYKTFDIYQYCLDHCHTDEEKIRCMEELVLFEQMNMINILTVMKYIIDILREHNIVWGVGRGSSVASYVLYVLGVHKINSLKYGLDYTEFLRLGEK